MRLPVISGLIERRVLANFRVDPDALSAVLPEPFRPQLVGGYGIAGICLIRLAKVRPKFLPLNVGLSSENAAHRIAVEWDDSGTTRTGVYVPRRDTSSHLNCLAGGRVFPGVHHLAKFDVRETDENYFVAMTSKDGRANVLVEGTPGDALPSGSVFESVDAVSRFFQEGSLGYSPNIRRAYDGLELRCTNWSVAPLNVSRVETNFFEDQSVFAEGSVTFDNALLMLDIEHEWHARKTICCDDIAL